jgi:serine protease Do
MIAAALAVIPIALSGCGAPAPVEAEPTTAPTSDTPVPEEEKEEESEIPAGFTQIFDDSGILSVQVPDTYTDMLGNPVTTSTGVALFNVIASPDLEGYNTRWDTPGMTFGATQDFSMPPEEYLTNALSSVGPECEDGETDVYDDGLYVGNYLWLPNCGGVGSEFLAIVATDPDQTHLVVVQMTMVSDEDKTTNRDQILSTFLATFQ